MWKLPKFNWRRTAKRHSVVPEPPQRAPAAATIGWIELPKELRQSLDQQAYALAWKSVQGEILTRDLRYFACIAPDQPEINYKKEHKRPAVQRLIDANQHLYNITRDIYAAFEPVRRTVSPEGALQNALRKLSSKELADSVSNATQAYNKALHEMKKAVPESALISYNLNPRETADIIERITAVLEVLHYMDNPYGNHRPEETFESFPGYTSDPDEYDDEYDDEDDHRPHTYSSQNARHCVKPMCTQDSVRDFNSDSSHSKRPSSADS